MGRIPSIFCMSSQQWFEASFQLPNWLIHVSLQITVSSFNGLEAAVPSFLPLDSSHHDSHTRAARRGLVTTRSTRASKKPCR